MNQLFSFKYLFIILGIIINSLGIFASDDLLPPADKNGINKSNNSRKTIPPSIKCKEIPLNTILPAVDAKLAKSVRAQYSIGQLAKLSPEEIVKAVLSMNSAYEINDLFQFNEGAKEFYLNSNITDALFNAFENSGKTYTKTDDKKLAVLVEILRAGCFLGFYNAEMAYVNSMEFKNKFVPGFDAIVSNPNFGWSSKHGLDASDIPLQDQIIATLGTAMGSGVSSVFSLQKIALLLKEFNDKNLMRDPAKANVVYTLCGGIDYALYWSVNQSNNNPQESIYWNHADEYLQELGKIALYGPTHEDRRYVVLNAIFWLGYNSGKVTQKENIVSVLNNCLNLYEKFSDEWLETIRRISDTYRDSFPEINIDELKTEVHDNVLPNKYEFDDGKLVFITGDKVDADKIRMLYWATKEVKSYFQRITLTDSPIADPNPRPDDVLTAYIYNSPAEYKKYNTFLYNLNTNNGGMYIEGWGKFFTYERTIYESTLSLEDLFRHEFTHFLQGRYLCPGDWGAWPLYQDDRLTWVEEGSAEFQTGSTRLDGVKHRWTMVNQVNSNPEYRMTLPQVVRAKYSSGFEFYTYAYVAYHFMHDCHPELMFDLYKRVQSGDVTRIEEFYTLLIDKYSSEFLEYMDDMKKRQNEFSDPDTPYDYYADITPRSESDIFEEIINEAKLKEPQTSKLFSTHFNTYEVRGNFILGKSEGETKDRLNMDKKADEILSSLSQKEWNGYKTTTAHFVNYKIDENKIVSFDLAFKGFLPDNVNALDSDLSFYNISLSQNIPNPATNETIIQFTTTRTGKVKLVITDTKGSVLRIPVNRDIEAGEHSITVDVSRFPSGVYHYTLYSGDKQITRKMIIR